MMLRSVPTDVDCLQSLEGNQIQLGHFTAFHPCATTSAKNDGNQLAFSVVAERPFALPWLCDLFLTQRPEVQGPWLANMMLGSVQIHGNNVGTEASQAA